MGWFGGKKLKKSDALHGFVNGHDRISMGDVCKVYVNTKWHCTRVLCNLFPMIQ